MRFNAGEGRKSAKAEECGLGDSGSLARSSGEGEGEGHLRAAIAWCGAVIVMTMSAVT
jgi:hypothetical protein